MPPHPLANILPVRPRKDDPTGLVAVGGSITPATLVAAASIGMFPWTGRFPIPWCSPDPRAIFTPGGLRVSRSLRKSLNNRGYTVTFDHAFSDVVAACAQTPRPGQPGTWITQNLVDAWTALHEQGVYHSVEVWLHGDLVGGLVGMALGRMFLGDTMFHTARDASKVGFVTLCRHLENAGYTLIDAQAPTPHLRSLGAIEVSRQAYIHRLKSATELEVPGRSWRDGIPPLEPVSR